MDYSELYKCALNAIDKGFYANPNTNKRYGAAVLTKSGNIYSAGQYSSFNHITSVHAEMCAVITATMSGEPDIVALALACSIPDSNRICGVCLQFLKEHYIRTKTDIDIITSVRDEIVVKKISEITKEFW